MYVVTGGSRGLGRATAEALVADGARVVVSSRDAASVESAVAALGPGRAVGVAADLADPDVPARLVRAAQEGFGRLDGALVSVGGPPRGSVLETSDEDWETAFRSVFLGSVRTAREVARHLAEGDGGSVALVLSTSTKSPIDQLAISNGFRPGLGMVVKQLADEVGRSGVRVNGLLPGRVMTDRVRELDAAGQDPAAARANDERGSALGRTGQPEEFGRVAAFVLSPAASYVTGAMIPVDGGVTRAL